MDVIVAANADNVSSYGDDHFSTDLTIRLSEAFEKDVPAFPMVTGTTSNALALSADIFAAVFPDIQSKCPGTQTLP